jgi:hypothetical protein
MKANDDFRNQVFEGLGIAEWERPGLRFVSLGFWIELGK